jgi:hypothetical protein
VALGKNHYSSLTRYISFLYIIGVIPHVLLEEATIVILYPKFSITVLQILDKLSIFRLTDVSDARSEVPSHHS